MKTWETLKQLCPKLYKHEVLFECGFGWYDILRDLSIKIERILDKQDEEEAERVQMYAIQIKEKYGTLRFYMSWETEELWELIRDAEALSSQTCENCGASAKMHGVDWFEVKCDDCYREKQ